MSTAYILATIAIFAAIVFILIRLGKLPQPEKLSNIAKVSFLLILMGIIFGENRILGYSLIGAGMILAIVDLIKKTKSK